MAHDDSDEPQTVHEQETAKHGPTVVGIGASAGGLAALQELFAHVPADSGLAYVVVVHLSPEHESHLAEILQPHVRMPVQQVAETVQLAPNRVYIIPPNANLNAIDTHLRLSQLEEERRQRAPVDHFFRTLSRTHDGRAVGVILTGTGSDGALGIKEIKGKGGLTVVQAPNEAEYDDMPQNAIATGLVDLVLPLAEIPGAVMRYAQTTPRVPVSDREGELAAEERRNLQKVFAQIRARTGRDFSRYKRSTILRRIARRMQLHQIENLPEYLDLLRTQPGEARALTEDLLITVTNFFRDPEVYERLEREVIPRIFARKQASDEIRIWSAGCATGEEAYSLAILLLEEADRQEASPHMQIFASDIHARSLERARDGFYPGDIETEVSAERLQRFFIAEEGGYRIKRELREAVVFAPHDLLSDPPFSRLDLLSCRNVLIYLQRDVQQEVMELFHYALRPNGFLLLGTSETVDRSDLFLAEDKKSCIYRRRDAPTPEARLPVFPLAHPRLSTPGDETERQRQRERVHYGEMHARVVERYAPPSLLVGPDDRVVHLSEHAGRYLVHPGGEPSTTVFKLIRPELEIELRTALSEARHGQPSRSRPIAVQLDGETRWVVLDIHPTPTAHEDGYVLLFFDESAERDAAAAAEKAARPKKAGRPEPRAHREGREQDLELERDQMRQRLQAIIEEYETSQEEMKASNEELHSINEELRSAMEELETSKEELQSMNEELQTVNQENRHKMEELAQLSGDLQNFLAATDIATLFLDRELRIVRFTPRVEELFSIRLADRGRPLSDLTHRLGYDEIQDDAAKVLAKLVPIEREVKDRGDLWYLTRVLPYRSAEDRIEGVVINFVDITERKRSEAALLESEQQIETELAGMKRLHELVARLLVSADLGTALDEVLGATMEITNAAMGKILLVDPLTEALDLVAHRGFAPELIERLEGGAADDTACGRASSSGVRVVIEDVEQARLTDSERELAAAAGYRAMQATPLLSRNSELLGVLSTHYREPTSPSERDLRLLDLYTRQAAEFIEHVRSQEAMIRADRLKDEFLAMLGHELRNPLTPIVTALALLREPGLSPERRSDLLDMIGRQERQLSRLVEDLLDISRITSGKIRLQMEVVDLRQVIEEAVETHRTQIERLEQRVELVLPVTELPVEGDRVRLQQIVGNLLHNASKYSPEGGRIVMRARQEDGRLSLKIADDGIGMDEKLQREAFELFAQGDGALARSEGGLGVGLTTVQRLVEMHGGSIEIESAGPGRGTTVTVLLPVTTDRPADDALAEPRPTPGPTVHRNVLLVEDNDDAADALAELLQLDGHVCRVARTGQQALDLFSEQPSEVVLLDIGLPEMDGLEVASRVRRLPGGGDVLLVALTGYGETSLENRANLELFDHYILKPVDPAKIKQLVAEGVPEGHKRSD